MIESGTLKIKKKKDKHAYILFSIIHIQRCVDKKYVFTYLDTYIY